jgi:hypothetical protein
MGRCWSIASSSLKKFEEVSEWLLAQPGWKIRAGFEKDEQRTIVRYGSTFNAILMSLDAKRGVANQLSSHLGVLPRFLISIEDIKNPSLVGMLDVVYQLAFEFVKNDPSPLLFRQDTEIVFVRDLNQFLVKPDFFESKSIASLLPSPFEVCERFD